jgi:hypothetical protein
VLYGGKVQALGTLRDLLARPDSIRITTPPLPRETMERVLELIRRDVSEDKVRVDTPTQNLESYFLDVVQRARASAETSGATSGNRVAAYLRGDGEAMSSGDRILDRLAARPKVEPAVTEPPAPVPAVNGAKLEALKAPTPARPAKPRSEPEPPADLSKANEKLSSLLNKPK